MNRLNLTFSSHNTGTNYSANGSDTVNCYVKDKLTSSSSYHNEGHLGSFKDALFSLWRSSTALSSMLAVLLSDRTLRHTVRRNSKIWGLQMTVDPLESVINSHDNSYDTIDPRRFGRPSLAFDLDGGGIMLVR